MSYQITKGGSKIKYQKILFFRNLTWCEQNGEIMLRELFLNVNQTFEISVVLTSVRGLRDELICEDTPRRHVLRPIPRLNCKITGVPLVMEDFRGHPLRVCWFNIRKGHPVFCCLKFRFQLWIIQSLSKVVTGPWFLFGWINVELVYRCPVACKIINRVKGTGAL